MDFRFAALRLLTLTTKGLPTHLNTNATALEGQVNDLGEVEMEFGLRFSNARPTYGWTTFGSRSLVRIARLIPEKINVGMIPQQLKCQPPQLRGHRHKRS